MATKKSKRIISIFLAFVMFFTSSLSVYAVDVPSSEVQQQEDEFIPSETPENTEEQTGEVDLSEEEIVTEETPVIDEDTNKDIIEVDEQPEREINEDEFTQDIVTTPEALMPMMAAMEYSSGTFLSGGSSFSSAVTVPFDADVDSSFVEKNEYDYFKFTAPYKGAYNVTANIGSSPKVPGIYATLYNATTGSSVTTGSGQSSTADREFSIMNPVLEPGEYVILMRSYSGNYVGSNTGNYSFKITKTIQDDLGDTLETATAIDLEKDYNAEFNYYNDQDYIKFTAPYKGAYNITVNVGPSPRAPGVYATLYNAKTGSSVSTGSGQSSTTDREFSIMNPVLEPGEYVILMRSYSGNYVGSNTGNYSFKITKTSQDDFGDTLETATVVDLEKDYNAEFNYYNDQDYIKFTAPYKGAYNITVNVGPSPKAPGVYATLYNAKTGSSVSTGSGQSSTTDREISIMNPVLEPGEYIILMRSYSGNYVGSNTGNYSFNITKTSQDDFGDTLETATVVDLEKDYNAEFNYNNDQDYIKFTAPYKGAYNITVNVGPSPRAPGVYATLYNAKTGSSVTTGSGQSSMTDKEISIMNPVLEAGEYIILMRSYSGNYVGSNIGTYDFKVTKTPKDDYADTAPTANLKKINTLYKGMINYTNDPDYLSFEVTEAGKYEIGSYAYGDTPITNMYTYLYKDTNGTLSLLAYPSFDTTTKKTTFTKDLQPGKYILHFKGYSSSYTGNYRFYFLKDGATLLEEPETDTMLNGTVYYDSELSVRNASFNMITNLAVDSLEILNGQLYLEGTVKGELGELLPISTIGKVYNNVSTIFEGEELLTADFHNTGNLTILSAEIEKSAREDMLLPINRERLKGKQIIKLSLWDEKKDRIYYFEDELPEGFNYDDLKTVATNPDASIESQMERQLIWFFDFMPVEKYEDPDTPVSQQEKTNNVFPTVQSFALKSPVTIYGGKPSSTIPINYFMEPCRESDIGIKNKDGKGYFIVTSAYPINKSQEDKDTEAEKALSPGILNSYYAIWETSQHFRPQVDGSLIYESETSAKTNEIIVELKLTETSQTIYRPNKNTLTNIEDHLLEIGDASITVFLKDGPEVISGYRRTINGKNYSSSANQEAAAGSVASFGSLLLGLVASEPTNFTAAGVLVLAQAIPGGAAVYNANQLSSSSVSQHSDHRFDVSIDGQYQGKLLKSLTASSAQFRMGVNNPEGTDESFVVAVEYCIPTGVKEKDMAPLLNKTRTIMIGYRFSIFNRSRSKDNPELIQFYDKYTDENTGKIVIAPQFITKNYISHYTPSKTQ